MRSLFAARYSFSSYIETLYQKSKITQTPFFSINSMACRIIEDPLDFYTVLSVTPYQCRVQSKERHLGWDFPVCTYRQESSKDICCRVWPKDTKKSLI